MRNVFGAGLLGCGLLLVAIFGLLTLLLVGGGLFSGGIEGVQIAGTALAVSGLPCAIGLAMAWLGRRQIRIADREARDRVQSDVFD